MDKHIAKNELLCYTAKKEAISTEHYIFQTDRIFYKHEISKDLPCDAYSMHTHGCYELIYFVNGSASHVIEDRKYKLKKGDLILIRPLHYHFIQIDGPEDYERYDILFDPKAHGVEGTELLPSEAEVISLSQSPIAADIFRKCELYRDSCDEKTFECVLPHLLSELFYGIHMLCDSSAQKSSFVSPLISRALEYINKNLCTISSVSEIAEHLFVSPSYLFRIFKKELHKTPRAYILEKRLLLAQQMLASGKRPVPVSEQCGFHDYSSFYRNYLTRFGISPSAHSGAALDE